MTGVSSQAGLSTIRAGVPSAPRVGAERVQVRIEWGVQIDHSTTVYGRDEKAARFALIAYRATDHPDATLVSRRVEVHPWRAES